MKRRTIALTVGVMCVVTVIGATQERLPIIDMHMHARGPYNVRPMAPS